MDLPEPIELWDPSDPDVALLTGGENYSEDFFVQAADLVTSEEAFDDLRDPDSPVFQIDTKIARQLERRGWTVDDISELMSNAARTVSTRDQRWRPDGSRNNDLATAYIQPDGHYIVVNDRTRDIVQVSDRNDSYWVAPWDE